MNEFTLKITRGEDKTRPIYLCNERDGTAVDLTPAGITVSVTLESGAFQFVLPQSEILFNQPSLLKNEIRLLFPSSITQALPIGVYDAKVRVSYPNTTFASGFQREEYLVRRVIQVE